jgi:hypothetical protein
MANERAQTDRAGFAMAVLAAISAAFTGKVDMIKRLMGKKGAAVSGGTMGKFDAKVRQMLGDVKPTKPKRRSG